MGSFRNRLLVLIIGLVIVTQSVTLVAVLARTARTVEGRASDQLTAGGVFVEELIRFRASQLANGVAVLATDFGFREAVASGEGPTMLSAGRNHAQRIGADLMLLLDANGHLLASTARVQSESSRSLARLLDAADMAPDQPHVMVLDETPYQFFLAPVRAPDTIGWIAMGFKIDDHLARRMRELVGAQISLAARDSRGRLHLASTLSPQEQQGLGAAQLENADRRERAHQLKLGTNEYLTVARRLDSTPDPIVVFVHRPMHEVLAPYRDVRDAMLAIGTAGLLLALAIALLAGRSASQPIASLVDAARRIAAGRYDKSVAVRGPTEFRLLARAVNAMQEGIAERESRITHLAYHDALTGLPNRAFAETHIEELVRTTVGEAFALILVDLRNLAEINATLGHHMGDDALSEVARRLRQNVAQTDLVARLSAHQFLVATGPCSVQRAPLFAEQLVGTIRAGFHVGQVSLDMQSIAGISVFPDHGSTARELLRCAQMALHDAEEARTRVAVYGAGRDEQHRRRLALLTELPKALERGDLSLVYQPKVDMNTRSVKSLEALARWTHPQLGAVSPSEFVPLAEQTGNSRQLTSWVVAQVVKQMAEWRAQELEVDIAINLSAGDILDAQLGDEILRVLEKHGMPPTALLLEITESAVMRDPVLAARNMQLLRVAGVRFAIDDFGTGYSSLSHLSRLPVDEIKIDRSLIAHAHLRRDDTTIVASTIELGHSMGLKVVAEGVEEGESWNLLRRLGCDLAQGYLISKPLDVQAVPAFVRQANQLLQDSDSTVRQIRALEQLSNLRR